MQNLLSAFEALSMVLHSIDTHMIRRHIHYESASVTLCTVDFIRCSTHINNHDDKTKHCNFQLNI